MENGHIKRITDGDIQSSVLEVASANVATTYITCPADPEKTLGIKLPFLVMIIKNLNRYFSFEVQVLDDKNVRRRFRASNYQVRPKQRQRSSLLSVWQCSDVLHQATFSMCLLGTGAQSGTRVKPFICTMPLRLDEGWNQVHFNLSDFTRRAYGEFPASLACTRPGQACDFATCEDKVWSWLA